MATVFFMLPDEQVAWLHANFEGTGYWCWVRKLTHDSYLLQSPFDFDQLDFSEKAFMELDIGMESLQAPIFEKTGYGRDLDFPRSRCVQFAPSLALPEGKHITRGQLAIAPAWSYEFDGVPFEEVQDWYKRLGRSLKKEMDRSHIVYSEHPIRRRDYFRSWHVTAGVVNRVAAGWQLDEMLYICKKSEAQTP